MVKRRRVTYTTVGTLVVGLLVSVLVGMHKIGEGYKYDRSNQIIRCISGGEQIYYARTGKHPNTLEECLQVAASQFYCADASCASGEVRDAILAGRDAWGRRLEFEKRRLESGLLEVTIISIGSNGKREYSGADWSGDDIVGEFYIGKANSAEKEERP
jgi:hypothetical protein